MASNYESNLIVEACGWHVRGEYSKAVDVFMEGMDKYADTRKKIGTTRGERSEKRRKLEDSLWSANTLERAMREIIG